MIIFLTSSPGGHTWEQPVKPVPLDRSNGFIDNLRKFWKKDARVLLLRQTRIITITMTLWLIFLAGTYL